MEAYEMDAQAIEHYLTELGVELKRQGIKKPLRVMIIGGAYMLLLANAPRTTNDVDFCWLDNDIFQPAFSQETFNTINDCLQTITNKYSLKAGWFNYDAQMLMLGEAIIPNGKLWKRFGPLHIYRPPVEYVLALKITAGRDKDLEDCDILLPQTKIKTRQQAQRLLDRYITPEGQTNNAEEIERTLSYLFGEK